MNPSALLLALSLLYSCLYFQETHLSASPVHILITVRCIVMLHTEAFRKQNRRKALRRKTGILCVSGFQLCAVMYILIYFQEVLVSHAY